MSVFVDLVPKLLTLPGALGTAPSSLHLLRKLSSAERGAVPESIEWDDSQLLASSVRNAVLDLLDAIAQEGTLIMVLEDLHWADPRSLDLISELLEWIATRKICVVCTSRLPLNASYPSLVVHKLPPLSTDDTWALAQLILQSNDASLTAGFDRLLAVAQGNPFYICELVGYWLKSGNPDVLPPSVSALLDQRLELLDPTALTTLQCVATLERYASVSRISAALGYSGSDLLLSLGHLESQGLITEIGGHVSCTHDLVARAALARLSPIATKVLHRLSAQVLETDSRDSTLPSLLWECSRHWSAAGHPDRAITFALDCARHLLDVGLPHEAAELLKAARPLARDPAVDNEVSTVLCLALHRSVQWNELLTTLRAKRLPNSQNAHDDEELMLVDAEYRVGSGDPETLLASTVACASNTVASADHRLGAACQGLIIADGRCDDFSAGRLFFAVRDLIGGGAKFSLLSCEISMLFHTTFGDLETGAAAARVLLQHHRVQSSASTSARYLRFAAIPLRAVGCIDEAESLVLEALDIARKARLDYAEYGAAVHLANIALAANNPDSALKWYETAMKINVIAADPLVTFDRALVGIRAYLSLGDLAKGRTLYAEVAGIQVKNDLYRPACYARALQVRMKTETDAVALEQSEIESLALAFAHTRSRLSQDFCASALVRGLIATGQHARAHQCHEDYVSKYRRDRTPLLLDLVQAFSE